MSDYYEINCDECDKLIAITPVHHPGAFWCPLCYEKLGPPKTPIGDTEVT